VPFLVRWPEGIKPGEDCSTTIVFNDLIPTLAEMLGIRLEQSVAEDGRSFFKALTGDSRPGSFHKAIVHNHADGTFAIRRGSFKLTVKGPRSVASVLKESTPVSFVLHDLSQDVEEATDVARDHPAAVQEMYALLKEYLRNDRGRVDQ
jgi:arylsulfatase A